MSCTAGVSCQKQGHRRNQRIKKLKMGSFPAHAGTTVKRKLKTHWAERSWPYSSLKVLGPPSSKKTEETQPKEEKQASGKIPNPQSLILVTKMPWKGLGNCKRTAYEQKSSNFSSQKNILYLSCKSNIVLLYFVFVSPYLYPPWWPIKEDTVGKNYEHRQQSDYKSISPLLHCWSMQEKPNSHSSSTFCSCKQSHFISELLCGNRWFPNAWLLTTVYGSNTTELLN